MTLWLFDLLTTNKLDVFEFAAEKAGMLYIYRIWTYEHALSNLHTLSFFCCAWKEGVFVPATDAPGSCSC